MSELKSYINRVLGNSLRCLLPSYWWKRLFGLVVDRINEVESTLSSSIDEVKRDVKIPIVESEEDLESLDVPMGELATVIGKGRSFRECYWPTEFPENGGDIFPLLTHIPNINVLEGPITSTIVMVLEARNNVGISKVIQLVVDNDQQLVGAVDGEANRVYILSRYGQVYADALQEFNDLLASDVYRYIGRDGNDNLTEDEFDALDKLIRWDVSSDVYIKGGSWERLVKERDLEGIGSGITNTDGLEIRELHISQLKQLGQTTQETQLTDEQKAYNLETLELARQNKAIVSISIRWVSVLLYLNIKEAGIFLGSVPDAASGQISTIGGVVGAEIDEQGNGFVETFQNDPDDELSDTSINTVQNKVVTAALKDKVDKVDGKQLSTEDFTSLLKAKLEGLNNYDDTSIRNAINSLDSIIAAIEQQIAGCVTTAILEREITNVERQITGVATTIPQRTSQLNNDSGFTTEEYVNTQVRTAIISALNTEV